MAGGAAITAFANLVLVVASRLYRTKPEEVNLLMVKNCR